MNLSPRVALRGADIRAAMTGEVPIHPRVICAWHPGWNPLDPANIGASHGMCASCEATMRAKMDAEAQPA